MKNSYFLVFVFLLVLNSCKPETIEDARKLSIENDFKTISANDYQLMVPNYMTLSEDLNPEASLQYMHTYKEEYIIVIDEPKSVFKEAIADLNEFQSEESLLIKYRDAQLNFTNEVMDIIKTSSFKSLRINKLKAESVEMEAKLQNLESPITYFFFYIESKEKLYTIMAWTLSSKKAIYKEKVKKIIQTFKPI